MGNTADVKKLINSMRTDQNAPNAFKALPIATDSNVAEIATGFLTYPEVRTYFWQTLVNRIALTVFKNPEFKNPFSKIRKSSIEVGQTIQQIFVRLCEEHDYSMDNPEHMLSTENPDLDAVYFILNRQKYFKQTIFDNQLRSYFSSWQQLNDFVSAVIKNMITSDEVNEYEYCKQALEMYSTKGLYYNVHIDPVIDDTTGAQAIQVLQAYAQDVGFAKVKYNARKNVNATQESDLILFITVDFNTKLGALTRSRLFNPEDAEYLRDRIVIDNFGENSDIQAVLCSKDFLNLRNYLVESGAFYNPEILGTNHWYHHHEYIYTSQLEPAIAFTTAAVGTDSVTSVTITPATVTLPINSTLTFTGTVVATGNATKNLIWTITDNVSQKTLINSRTGVLFIADDETSTTITVTATSEFDETKKGTSTVTVGNVTNGGTGII